MSGDAAAAAQPVGSSKTPADFLKSIRGRPVVVKLNSGVDYRGTSYFLSVFQVLISNFDCLFWFWRVIQVLEAVVASVFASFFERGRS